MFRRLCVWILLASPPLTFAADKEIMALQRDVAQLQDMVRQLQQSQDERFAALQTLVQQAVNSANDAGKAVAVIQSTFRQNLTEQESKVVTPVVGLTTRMDNMSGDFRTLQGAVADLTSAVNKIQTQLTDVNNQLKVMQAPPAAPPPQPGDSSGGPGGEAAASAPCIPATDLFANADRDRLGGHYDLALQEYADYLRCYGNTDQAPRAQYYIGYIHYGQGELETAASDFDLLLEKYPTDNPLRPDAFYYKGMSLRRSGQRTAAGSEFRDLIEQYPRSDLAKKACSELKSLGYQCPSTAAPAKAPAKRKK